MKLKTSHYLAFAAVALSGSAFAQTAAPAPAPAADPAPPYTISPNVTLVTDYVYRGVSQSSRKPAIQVGVDYVNTNGFYASTLLQNIDWIKNGFPGAKGPAEWDFWGGYKADIVKDVWSYDLGGLYYYYPTNTAANFGAVNANTFEFYGDVTWKLLTVKYSRSMTNVFANPNSKGSGYLEAAATFDVGNGFSITPHLGHQTYKNNTLIPNYTDYALTLNKDFAGMTFGAALEGTNRGGSPAAVEVGSGKNIYKSTLVLSLNKKF